MLVHFLDVLGRVMHQELAPGLVSVITVKSFPVGQVGAALRTSPTLLPATSIHWAADTLPHYC